MDEKIPEPLSKPLEPTKPAANVAPEQAHAAMATSTPMGTPAANVGKSSKGKKALVVFLVLILMVSTAAFGYLWWQARSAQAQLSQLKSDKEVAEKKASEAEAKLRELEKEEEGPIRARDVRRKEDLNAISSGLEQYYNDNQAYPAAMTDLTAGNYLKEIPTDPRNNNAYVYTPLPNTGPPYTSFTLQATLENQNDKDIKSGTTDTYEVVNKQ